VRSLAELAVFVGAPGSGLRTIGDAITTLTDPERRSLRLIAEESDRLPDLTLDAQFFGRRSGRGPREFTVRLSPTAAAVWQSWVSLAEVSSGATGERNAPPAGGDVVFALGRGEWRLAAHRSGVSREGAIELSRPLGEVRVEAALKPRPDDPPKDPPRVDPPGTATCAVTFERYFGQNLVELRVSGSGFRAGEDVSIVVDGNPTTTAPVTGAQGAYSAQVSLTQVPAGEPKVTHTFVAVSPGGKISNTDSYDV
jgi:hypothetical protein